MIPKIIHITIKDENIPDFKKNIIVKWKELNPEFEVKIHTDESNDLFVKQYNKLI